MNSMTISHTHILSDDRPICIAILAMGGQGGGVLADWIVALAENQGWVAQSTSVPGVAQRTGATIYYIEIIRAPSGVHPILALMPTPGDVDIVIAAELMEAGRSVLRGLVTPDKTALIASTHRAYAVGEKEKPGDGTGNPVTVIDATDFAARKTVAFDMERLATRNGSVVSSALFGALAASGALPFEKSAYEATIRSGGKGVEASVKAFDAAFERTLKGENDKLSAQPAKSFEPLPVKAGHPKLDALVARIRNEFPIDCHAMLFAGVKKATDFQDADYGDEYLTRMAALHRLDRAAGGEAHDFAFTTEAAKHVANAFTYDDVMRVADLKVRSSRFERIRSEVGVRDGQILTMTEYMHPRMEEVCGTLPSGLGAWIENHPSVFHWLDLRVNKGRRVKTATLGWFLMLYMLSGLKGIRRKSLRHGREIAHREDWLLKAQKALTENYDLAVEVIRCRRLVKGYSDTHARGLSKFDRTLGALPLLSGRDDAADWLRRLRTAALADEAGDVLDGAIMTVKSL
ncbi:indolepyruvate oxidoreductase subunit beta family protein [Rhizobium sp. FY34]|uniref:indolepyruvate oxidoreductase subunit beta family protein n=1 Tax=Rhizobium sp. FY34 TaxID=2562309 RepID=UPI0010C00700|nr:indolepyruvate oxidoreductase subunit beta family protein [Rhizobium sp. FY34]